MTLKILFFFCIYCYYITFHELNVSFSGKCQLKTSCLSNVSKFKLIVAVMFYLFFATSFWNRFITYLCPRFSFVIFAFHISRCKCYISLYSYCVVIVSKLHHVRVSFLRPSCLWIPKYSSTGSWQNLSVRTYWQPLESKY